MAFIDVVTLAEAKSYLRVDDGFTADDSLITTLINAAGSIIEQHTNHLLFSRDKTYQYFDGILRVYDYPINTDISALDYDERSLYTIFDGDDSLDLNVGYADPADVPSILKVKMLEVVDALYNGNENESVTNFNDSLFKSLGQFRRFVV
jgi:hypothetical protein